MDNLYLHNHFKEIRLRSLYSLYSCICTFLFCYFFQIELLYIIIRPFLELNHTLLSTQVTEALSSIVTLCFLFALLIGFPLSIYQIWCFYNPSQYGWEHRTLWYIGFIFLFYSELFSIYWLILPQISEFFTSFQIIVEKSSPFIDQKTFVEISPRLDSIIEYTLQVFVIFLVCLQIPLGFLYCFYQKILHSTQLCSNRRTFFLCFLCLSACISPPDIQYQLLSTLFCMILFELCILLGYIYYSFQRKKINIHFQNKSLYK